MEECYFKFVFPYWKFVLRHILVFKVDTFLLNQNIPENHLILSDFASCQKYPIYW